jgi:heptosyltransferase-1
MGDLFHALPAVHNLKVGLDAQIDWVTHDYYVDLVKCFSDVDRVIPFYRRSFFRNFSRFVDELRKEKYDLVVDMQGLMKSAVVTTLARGKRKIGPSFYREGARVFYNEIAGMRNKERHAVEENLDIVRHLGLNLVEPVFPVEFPDAGLEGKDCKIGIVPLSRWETKNWPVQCYTKLIERLSKQCEATFYLLGGRDDVGVCEEIANGLSADIVNMAGKSSFVEMGGILKQMDLLISNDSGPVHVAAAAGTPTLVVFGPTDSNRTGPYGDGHKVVTAGLDCQPCFSRSCRNEGIACLEGVTPEHVGELALEMLHSVTTP